MLIVKVSTSLEKVDEIHVQNKGNSNWGRHKYQIIKPEGFEKEVIYHRRTDGYTVLLRMVMDVLIKNSWRGK